MKTPSITLYELQLLLNYKKGDKVSKMGIELIKAPVIGTFFTKSKKELMEKFKKKDNETYMKGLELYDWDYIYDYPAYNKRMRIKYITGK